jgi:hypothetical protein
VLEAIYTELKNGASQLSGTRPSLLACLIEEVEDEDWETLRNEAGLRDVAAKLLANPSRHHINLVAFNSDRTLPKTEENVVSFVTTNLMFWQTKPKFILPRTFAFREATEG